MESNEISVASPRTSGAALAFDEFDARTVKNVSRKVWIWKVPGVSKVGIMVKDSREVMASELAVKRPILSQLRYLVKSQGELISNYSDRTSFGRNREE